MRWIAISQSVAVVAAGVILPFYILVLQETTDSYALFAYLYGTFTLAAALTHFWIGPLAQRLGVRALLVVGNLVAAVVVAAVPSLRELWQFYVAQVVLGIALSWQKSGEKIAVAAAVRPDRSADQIGRYHAWVALLTAVALFVSGWLLDSVSLVFLFYLVAGLLAVAAALSVKVPGVKVSGP